MTITIKEFIKKEAERLFIEYYDSPSFCRDLNDTLERAIKLGMDNAYLKDLEYTELKEE